LNEHAGLFAVMKWAWAVGAAILLSSCAISSSSTPVPSPSPVSSPVPGPAQVARQVLPPARGLPVVALCSQPLTTDRDGNTGPILCTDGGLNVMAWKFFAPSGPRVLSVGPAASPTAVDTAIRRDCKVSHTPALRERSAYELAAAYYGWYFNTDPTDYLNSVCA
jgi:hypothetical protein